MKLSTAVVMGACALSSQQVLAQGGAPIDSGPIGDLQAALDALTARVAALESDVSTNASGIATNASGIATNASGIATNAAGVSNNQTTISSIQSSVGTLQGDFGILQGDVSALASAVATAQGDIGTLQGEVISLQLDQHAPPNQLIGGRAYCQILLSESVQTNNQIAEPKIWNRRQYLWRYREASFDPLDQNGEGEWRHTDTLTTYFARHDYGDQNPAANLNEFPNSVRNLNGIYTQTGSQVDLRVQLYDNVNGVLVPQVDPVTGEFVYGEPITYHVTGDGSFIMEMRPGQANGPPIDPNDPEGPTLWEGSFTNITVFYIEQTDGGQCNAPSGLAE